MQHPERIGKYEIEKFLGGGMSHVYKARDAVIGRAVALKILTEAGTNDPETKARFLREAQLAGSLAHENVMAVYDFGESGGNPYMVMEFLRGEDLRGALDNGRCGGPLEKLKILQQAARGLGYIHQRKIIHRDIKPENIHLTETGTVKLMDFGIAKTQELSLTRAGYTMGTPYYMAPEQVMGRDVTHLADIYAFGIMVYEMLTGVKPFVAGAIEQLFYKVINEPVPPEPLAAAGVPPRIVQLIARCTAKNAADRPQSFAEVLAELDAAIAEIEAPAALAAAAPVSSGKPLYILAAALVLVVIVAGYIIFRPKPEQPAQPVAQQEPPKPVLATPTGEMALIPAGNYLTGPNHDIAELPAFYIDRTEVTVAQYVRFCQEKQRPLPSGFQEEQPDLPATNMTFIDAQEFAKWAGKRLPTMAEWEKAARGTDGRPYPWGEAHDPTKANVADNPAGRKALAPVGGFREGATPLGVQDLAGNAWEFVDQLRTPSPGALQAFARLVTPPPTADEPWYTIAGGAFDTPLVKNVAWEWSSVPARYRTASIGFRCVKTP